MEIHGDAPEVVEHWMGILDERGDAPPPPKTAAARTSSRPRRPTCRTSAGAGAAGAAAAAAAAGTLDAGRRRWHGFSAAAATRATSSIVLYGLASFSAISSLMIGHAGSISLALKLNFGLRG